MAASASRRVGADAERREQRERTRESNAQESLPECTQEKQLPAGAGSRTSSDFHPPSIDTILREGLLKKECRGLCLNVKSSKFANVPDRHSRCRDSNSVSSFSAILEFSYLCEKARLNLQRLGTRGLRHYGNSILHPHGVTGVLGRGCLQPCE